MRFEILFGLLAVMMLSGIVYADNAAALQITAHSTIPEVLYPGSSGQLQLTIMNTGTDPAGSVHISYKTPAQATSSDVYIGDIGAGSSAIASIPINVPQKTSSGFFIVDLDVVYFGDLTHSVVKNAPATIPIVVGQHQILSAKTISVTPATIAPGDPVDILVRIENTGGVMNGATINAPDSSTFTLEGGSSILVGDVQPNSTKEVSLRLISSSTTATGKYSVPLAISYQDALQSTVNQTINIGPITVSDSSAQFRITMEPVSPTEVGSVARFSLSLENAGEAAASPVVDLNSNTQFTPIGATRIFFEPIGPGETATKNISIGVSSSAAAGYYNLPLEITSNGRTYEQNVGVVVNATPDIVITADSQPSFISSGSNEVKILAQISNTGNSPIRSVYATVAPQRTFGLVGTTDKFIGTLNVDDFATFQFTISVPQNMTPGDYAIPVRVTFKDANNAEHSLARDVSITVYQPQEAMRLNSASGSGTAGTTPTGTNGFSGGRNGGGSGLFGFSWIQIGIALVVVVAAYFGYRKWKGGKK